MIYFYLVLKGQRKGQRSCLYNVYIKGFFGVFASGFLGVAFSWIRPFVYYPGSADYPFLVGDRVLLQFLCPVDLFYFRTYFEAI